MRVRSFYLLAAAGVVGVLVLAGSAEALPSACVASGSSVTCAYSYTGSAQTFTVPSGVNSIVVDVRGAAGGESGGLSAHVAGGLGADVQGTLAVTAGETLQVNVGGRGGTDGSEAAGWNGGGYGGFGGSGGVPMVAGGGGGASDVRDGAYGLADRLLVAGGGGGGGGYGVGSGVSGAGGVAGGVGGNSSGDGTGGTSVTGATAGGPGLAGSTSGGGGGSAGTGTGSNGYGGNGGGLGVGGNGGGNNGSGGDGGGGGGGYYGGGAGGGGAWYFNGTNALGAGGGGGGGGSNYLGSATATTVTDGYQSGNGQVTISYVQSSSACGTTLISSFTLTANIDCSGWVGPALQIGQAGITVNLNGFTISGGPGSTVIDNSSGYDGLTVENGTIVVQGAGRAVDNSTGGTGLVVSNMTLTGDGSAGSVGVDSEGMSGSPLSGTAVTGSTIGGFDEGVYLDYTAGSLVKGNTITTDAGFYGIDDKHSTGDMITGNTVTSAAAPGGTGINLDAAAGTLISGNTVTLTAFGLDTGGFSAGLMISGNVFGGASVSGTLGNGYGIALNGDSGDVINGNYVRDNLFGGIVDTGSFNTYTNNVLNANGGDNLFIDPNELGPVTVVNNYSNSAASDGFDITGAYSGTVPGGPYTLVSGNTALLNGAAGFDDSNNVGATYTHNIAGVINYGNNGYGFVFDAPQRYTISNNSATNNGLDGFYFYTNVAPHAPLAVTNNSATYNGVWGFHGAYPVAGSGNTGGNTNTTGDCYLVAGCS